MHSVYQEAGNNTLIQLQKMRHRGSSILSLLLLKLLYFVLNVFAKNLAVIYPIIQVKL